MTTAAELMTVDIPRSDGRHTVGDMMAMLRRHAWEEVGHVYLVDGQAALVRSGSDRTASPIEGG